jgi:hypothetical protein
MALRSRWNECAQARISGHGRLRARVAAIACCDGVVQEWLGVSHQEKPPALAKDKA